MNEKLILALVDKLVQNKFDQNQSNLRGPRGLKGRKGKDFDWDEYKSLITEKILETVSQLKPDLKLKFKDLTVDDLDNLKLNFTDLSEDEKESLKGPRGEKGIRGRDGRDGKDFSFEETKENITKIISSYIDTIKNGFKLKFEDLTEEQLEKIKGPKGARGQKGKQGKNFDWDEERSKIEKSIRNIYSEEKESFKLKFDDLSDKDKQELKLTLKDLTEEERLSLKGDKGFRGQKGKQGSPGLSAYDLWTELGHNGSESDFLLSLIGPQGAVGPSGRDAKDGKHGRDGKDAPRIITIEVNQPSKDSFSLLFGFSDNSFIESDEIELPEATKIIQAMTTYSQGGGGGGNNIETFDEGSSLETETLSYDFVGDGVTATTDASGNITVTIPGGGGLTAVSIEQDGVAVGDIDTLNFLAPLTATYDAINDRIDIGLSPTAGCVAIFDEGIETVSCVTEINFIGDGVEVKPRSVLSDWPTLDVIDPIAFYDFGQPEVDVCIPGDSPWVQPTGTIVVPSGGTIVMDTLRKSSFICAEYKICFRSIDKTKVMRLNYSAFLDDMGLGDQVYGKNGTIMAIAINIVENINDIEVQITNNEPQDVGLILTRLLG